MERHVRLFRNGRNKAVRIPKEFEFAGDDAVMRKEGECLIIEPKRKKHKKTLKQLFASWEPVDEEIAELSDSPPEPLEFL